MKINIHGDGDDDNVDDAFGGIHEKGRSVQQNETSTKQTNTCMNEKKNTEATLFHHLIQSNRKINILWCRENICRTNWIKELNWFRGVLAKIVADFAVFTVLGIEENEKVERKQKHSLKEWKSNMTCRE